MPDAAEPHRPRNRLSIAHLMLWTFCCAVFLAAFRLLPFQTTAAKSIWISVLLAIYSLPVGGQVAGFVVFAYRGWLQRIQVALLPGHWLLVAEGVCAAAILVGRVCAYLLGPLVGGSPAAWALAAFLPGVIARTVSYLFACRRTAQDPDGFWKTTFLLLSIEGFVSWFICQAVINLAAEGQPLALSAAAVDLLRIGSPAGFCCFLAPASLVIVVFAATTDPLRGKRDLLHWAGVAAIMTGLVLQLAIVHLLPPPRRSARTAYARKVARDQPHVVPAMISDPRTRRP